MASVCLVGCNFDDSLSNLDQMDMSASPADMMPLPKDKGIVDKGGADLPNIEDMGVEDAGPEDMMADLVQVEPCTSNPVFKSGTGAPDDPFIICSAEQFIEMSTMSGRFYALDRDIDLSGADWAPIEVFTGQLDGQGFAVLNLNVLGSESTGGFCNVLTGTLRDIAFIDLMVSSSGSGVGGVAHVSQGATVERVGISGFVDARDYAGMFAARINTGPQGAGVYDNIVIGADMVVYGEGPTADGSSQGQEGQVGIFAGEVNEGVTLARIHTEGVITAEAAPGGAWRLGGIVGRLRGATITESSALVDIIAQRSLRVGGIVGELDTSVVTNSWAEGNLVGAHEVGGIAGHVSGQSRLEFVLSSSTSEAAEGASGGVVGVIGTSSTATGAFAYYSLLGASQDALGFSEGLSFGEIRSSTRYAEWPSPPWIIIEGELPLLDSEPM